jgi:hypothetical protein
MVALSGTLGMSASADMSAFLSLERQLPKFADILEKPTEIRIPDDIAGQLMLMFQAVDTLQTQDELSSFMKYINRIESSEMQAVFFTMMVRSAKGVKLARSNADIAKWATENHMLF